MLLRHIHCIWSIAVLFKAKCNAKIAQLPYCFQVASHSFMIYCFKALIIVSIIVDILRTRWKIKITRPYISKLYRMFRNLNT